MLFSCLYADKIFMHVWEKGRTFSDYLNEHNISSDMLRGVSGEDIKFLSEIRSEHPFFELYDDNETRLLQALIPISEEMQIHLYRERDGDYAFDVIPVEYKEKTYFADINITTNPYEDTLKTVRYADVAKRLAFALKKAVDPKTLKKGDRIRFIYRQKTRLGKVYGPPKILSARIAGKKKTRQIYIDEEGRGHTDVEKKVAYTVKGKKRVYYTKREGGGKGKRFGMPLRHPRITSSFSYRRWHPILHRYRPHHGTDFGARRGTPIMAVNDGKVIFAGWMGGYGRTVKIKHGGGYISLYAHQSRIRVKRGQFVKRGQIIGYVGNTGRSTGPHLHLGIMKNGRWVDPMKVIGRKSVAYGGRIKRYSKIKEVPVTKYRKTEIKHATKYKKLLESYLVDETPTYIWDKSKFDDTLLEKVYIDEE
jgi:murein DD-endopeptidase MepM/ murein hydrolase activator NlpD